MSPAQDSVPRPDAPNRAKFTLTEDWLATLLGVAIVLVIGLGVFGPGGQTVALKAAPGKTAEKTARPLSGWAVAATLNGQKTTVAGAPKTLESGKTYTIACQNDQLAFSPEASSAAAPADRALIVLVNACSADVTVTYSTSALIPWPLFRLF